MFRIRTLLAAVLLGLVASVALTGTAHADSFLRTSGTNITLRGCAKTTCEVITTIRNKGTVVYPLCWTSGTSVSGNTRWYSVGWRYGDTQYYGYISAHWLTAPSDPGSRC